MTYHVHSQKRHQKARVLMAYQSLCLASHQSWLGQANKHVFSRRHFPILLETFPYQPIAQNFNFIIISDTRPIALLLEVSKILEKCAFTQLSDFVEANNLLGSFQSCYKKGQGTQTALLGLLEKTRLAIEDGKMNMIGLFDFLRLLTVFLINSS